MIKSSWLVLATLDVRHDVALLLNEGVVPVDPETGEVGSWFDQSVVLAAARLPPGTAVPRWVPLLMPVPFKLLSILYANVCTY